MTEIKEGAISLWIREMMVNEAITICPRCCENLITKSVYVYLEEKGIEQGAAEKLLSHFRKKLDIWDGYFLYADCVDGQLEKSGTEFLLCRACAEGGVSIYEKSKEWPIEGRFPKSLTRS